MFELKRADKPEARSTVRRGLNRSFEPKRGPQFELSGKAARRELYRCETSGE